MATPVAAAVAVLPLVAKAQFAGFLALLVAGALMYGLKARHRLIGTMSFAARGLFEVIVFLMVLSSNVALPRAADVVPLLAVLYLVTAARNLMGDVRDVDFDQFTFARTHGVHISHVLSAVLLAAGAALGRAPAPAFPLVLYVLVHLALRDACQLHRLLVLATVFWLANCTTHSLGGGLLVPNIACVGVMLNFTYPLVPRQSNPR